jgi:hypothetical protein
VVGLGIPVGLDFGQVVRLGKLPVNLQIAYYCNVERPDYASRYQIRAQAVLISPSNVASRERP